MSSPGSEPYHPSSSIPNSPIASKHKPKTRNPPHTTKSKPARNQTDHIRQNFLLHLASLADSITSRGFYGLLSHSAEDIPRPKISREISKEPSIKEEKAVSEFSSPDAQVIPHEATMGSTGNFTLQACHIKDMEDFRQRIMKDCEGILMRREAPKMREDFEGINGRRLGNMKDLMVLDKDFAFGELKFAMEVETEDIFEDFSSEEDEENELGFEAENQANNIDKGQYEEGNNKEQSVEEIHNEEEHFHGEYEEEELPEHPDPESLFIEDKMFESEKGEDRRSASEEVEEVEVMEIAQEESLSVSEGDEEEKVIGKSQESPIEIVEIEEEAVVAEVPQQEEILQENNNEEIVVEEDHQDIAAVQENNEEVVVQETNEEIIQEENDEEIVPENPEEFVAHENNGETHEGIPAEAEEVQGKTKEEELQLKKLSETMTEDMRDRAILKGLILSSLLDKFEEVRERRPRDKEKEKKPKSKKGATKKSGVIKVVETLEEVKKAFERQFKNGEEAMKKSMKQVQEKKQATFAKKVFSALTKTSSSINKKRNDGAVDSEGNKTKKKVKREAGWISLEPGLESEFASFMKEKDMDDDSDYETTTGFGGKGGFTPRKESEITEEEGRRRSMREKREPRKVYDKALRG